MVDRPVVGVWHREGAQWRLAGQIAGYETLEASTLHLATGPWSLRAPIGIPHLGKVTGAALITVDWQGHRWATGRLTNPVTKTEGRGRLYAELTGETGLTMLRGVCCWPDPTKALSGQPDQGVYGPADAETVIRQLLTEHYIGKYGGNLTLLGGNGHRGGDVRVRTRFTDLLDHVLRAARRGVLAVDVGLVDITGTRAQLTCSVREPTDRTATAVLSHWVGNLASWQHGSQRPGATRAYVGGGGTGATRVWRVVTTPESEAAAERWGGHVDVFVDAADIFDNAELDERGETAIAEGLSADTFTLEASSAPGVRIWERAGIGDTVTVELADGTEATSTTDTLGGLRLSAAREGTRVVPIVGDPEGETELQHIGKVVRRAVRRIRHLETTRDRT